MLLKLNLKNANLYDSLKEQAVIDDKSARRLVALNKAIAESKVKQDAIQAVGESILRLDLATVGKLPKSKDSRTVLLFRIYRRYKELIK